MVPFDDPFNQFYDQYSIDLLDFKIPAHFDVYLPDNYDLGCRSVLVPNPVKGARKWIQDKRWISIGIYRDSGRPTTLAPSRSGLSWGRNSNVLTIVDVNPHGLRVGSSVDVYNSNTLSLQSSKIIEILDLYRFRIQCPIIGSTSGSNLSYQSLTPINFNEDRIVFKLLPSFKLVPYSYILDLFSSTSPIDDQTQRSLFEITSSSMVKLPKSKSPDSNYSITKRYIADDHSVRFNQIFDEVGTPLPLRYNSLGYVDPSMKLDSITKNSPIYRSSPLSGEEYIDDLTQDKRIYVFDFYGLDLNDPSRSPYYSTNIIGRDPNLSIDNFTRSTKPNGAVIYDGPLYDVFGNVAVGVNSDKTLLIKSNVLPLAVDEFNKPIKQPTRR